MIKLEDLNPHGFKTNSSIDNNLKILCDRLNELENAWVDLGNMPFAITSGLRSDEFQEQLILQGKSNAKFSKHCAGAAADILDQDGSLAKWAMVNLSLLESIGFWIEHPDYTKGWLHVQIMAPKSGKRVFIP